MGRKLESKIFKKASKTYYVSSLFFPRKVRVDVFRLYSFVRLADNFVDDRPADSRGFMAFKDAWQKQLQKSELWFSPNDTAQKRAVKNMVYLVRKYDINPEWVEAFLQAMESDLDHQKCRTLNDSLDYVYGSAEVIGLMMAKILGLPKASYKAAQTQGRAMQWVNFIRDIDEDNGLERQYFPTEQLRAYGLKDLNEETATSSPVDFNRFMRAEIDRYKKWQAQAEAGYKFIPLRKRLAIAIANNLYGWSAEVILANPLIVYERKVKPGKRQILKIVYKTMLQQVAGRP